MKLVYASRRFAVSLYCLSLLGCTWLAVTEAQVCRLLSTQPNLPFLHLDCAHANLCCCWPCRPHVQSAYEGTRLLGACCSVLFADDKCCPQVYVTDLNFKQFGARSLLQSSPGSCAAGTLQAICSFCMLAHCLQCLGKA